MQFQPPEWHDQLESTNSMMLAWLREGKRVPNGSVLAAREQTAGRGRYDRKWVSRPNRDLTFSFLFETSAPDQQLMSLTMAVALAIAEHLDHCGVAASTKWPNDVLVEGRKIAGILAERHPARSPAGDTVIVVGIGLNVNLTRVESEYIDRPATSLLIETEQERAVTEVLDELLNRLSDWIIRWSAAGFEGIQQPWLDRCAFLGEMITVGDRTGTLAGFGHAGELLLRADSGVIEPVWAGDVDVLR